MNDNAVSIHTRCKQITFCKLFKNRENAASQNQKKLKNSLSDADNLFKKFRKICVTNEKEGIKNLTQNAV